MPETREDNDRIDNGITELVAERLKELLLGSGGLADIPSSSDSLGSPHLVDSLDEAPPQTIPPVKKCYTVHAIDGGSSVLALRGTIEVIAWRAAMVTYRDTTRITEQCLPASVIAYSWGEARDLIDEYIVDLPLTYIADHPPDRLVDDLRWLREWKLLAECISNAETDDLVLVDGSLRGNPAFDLPSQREVFRQAADRGVHVAAVTKQSSLYIQKGLSLDISEDGHGDQDTEGVWYRRLNRELPDGSGWMGNIYLARLHAGADKPYRIDINRYDTAPPEEIFAGIISVSDDIEWAGYPYPLVAAHRLARISAPFRAEMIETIGKALERKEMPAHIWGQITTDIHDRLNADIPELR
jgi:hypothetical protein